MLPLLIAIAIILFINLIVLILGICLICFILPKAGLAKNNFSQTTPNAQTLSEADLKDFYEEDREQVIDFMSALKDLNEFMTGSDLTEDIKNVRKQEE